MSNLTDIVASETLPQTCPPALTRLSGSGLTAKADFYGLDPGYHPKVEAATRQVVAWYNRGCGALVLAGNPGCGKTHLAKAVFKAHGGNRFILNWSQDEFGNSLVETIQNGVFYSEPEMLADIRQSYNGNGQSEAGIIRTCQQANLFVLDDLGVAHIRDESLGWAQDIYWRLFDARIDKFTLITTNLSVAEWTTRVGRRAFSRLMQALGGEAAIVDLFGVPDYRLKGWGQ